MEPGSVKEIREVNFSVHDSVFESSHFLKELEPHSFLIHS